eukprot:s1398_g6.t1
MWLSAVTGQPFGTSLCEETLKLCIDVNVTDVLIQMRDIFCTPECATCERMSPSETHCVSGPISSRLTGKEI